MVATHIQLAGRTQSVRHYVWRSGSFIVKKKRSFTQSS
jgi:hypothetical protein